MTKIRFFVLKRRAVVDCHGIGYVHDGAYHVQKMFFSKAQTQLLQFALQQDEL